MQSWTIPGVDRKPYVHQKHDLMALTEYFSTLRGILGLEVTPAAGQSSTSHIEDSGPPSPDMEQGLDLFELPDAVLLSVLDRLHPKELASTCCLVSHSMKAAALSNDLWRNRFEDLPEVSRLTRLLLCPTGWSKVGRSEPCLGHPTGVQGNGGEPKTVRMVVACTLQDKPFEQRQLGEHCRTQGLAHELIRCLISF